MSYKYTYPSIEYVLATGHYPEPARKSARHHPIFFPAPPAQVFHIAHGHIPVFIPLPPSYGYSTPTPNSRIHSENAAVFRPGNRCFTVTVPSSVTNKNLLSRNQSFIEPMSRKMGSSVMTMNVKTVNNKDRDSLPTRSVHKTSKLGVEISMKDVSAVGAPGASSRDISNKQSNMSESSLFKSDVETMPRSREAGDFKSSDEETLQDNAQGPQVLQDGESIAFGQARRWRSRTQSHLSDPAKAGSSGLANRKHTLAKRRGIQVE